MGSSEEERRVSPNASHEDYIDVHRGSTYKERTVAVRLELKSDQKRDRLCYDSSTVACVVD